MKVIKQGFILFHKYAWEEKGQFDFFQHEMAEHGYITVKPLTVEFDVPDDFDPRPGRVAHLQAKALEIKAKFAKDMMEIEDSISKETCIEMSPS